ncbi:MAG TPA: hypothetical protein PKC79_05250 [Solidesulfovibrio magneticus]|nr:hypothetical protein [Solidesulfovibrio magneticus]
MRITWHIVKKRGNLRPELVYDVVLEGHEKALALPYVRIDSTIPEPPSSWQAHCYPGQHERAGAAPAGFYQLATPNHATGTLRQSLRLPWREDNDYPEVEASFAALRRAFEAAFAAAGASQPMDVRGELTLTAGLKRDLAPSLMADRLLGLAQ